MNNNEERYKPTNDYIFSHIFGHKKNWELLKDLLEAILPHIQIKNILLVKQFSLAKQTLRNKGSTLDILAGLNNDTKVNIEMQVTDLKNTIERSLFYDAGIYHESLYKNENYKNAPRVIGIWILDYNLFDDGPFHEIAKLKREYENTVLTDKMELHYIQLPKFKEKCKRISSKLEQWLTFIINDNTEEVKMIDNEYVQKAEEELEYLNSDEEERELAKMREMAEWDWNATMASAKEEGIEEGEKKQKIETARKMLKEKLDIELIMKVTGLTEDEIKKL